MKKLFICLANSKKYGERCVAGIEVKRSDKGTLVIVNKGDKPKWIRPVTNLNYGAVPEHLVQDAKLLDVYEIDITEETPNGYQSENVKFNLKSLKKISSLGANNSNLEVLKEDNRSTLFSNRGKAVPEDRINDVDYSLVLLKAEHPEIFTKTYDSGGTQIRIKFHYKGNQYDLPITDKDFLKQYTVNNSIFDNADTIYVTVSLGVVHEGWHYKLAAGIICINE